MIETNFKNTEIGRIPEEWEVKTVEEFANITTGSQNTQDNVENGKYPFFVRSQKVERINKYIFDTEGVITAGDGVGTGKIFHYINGKFGLHQRCYLMHNFINVDAKYFYCVFSQNFYDRVQSMTAKSSVDSVRREMIAEMQIPLPPTLAEQTRIATALTSIDNLISSLDQLIEKKKNIKQGAMQQLLTGKKRIKGFGDMWVEKKLGEIADIRTGKRNGDEQKDNGLYPFFVRSQTVYKIDTYSYEGEAIIIPGEGGIGKIFHYINGKFDFHQRVYKISDFPADICVKYIYYYMIHFFGNYALQNTVKATVDSLRLPTFQSFVMAIPPCFAEQTAIASVLTSMDDEITALELKKAKYEQIKLGMMQQLLTGKIRLV